MCANYQPANKDQLANHFGVDPTAITTADLAVDMREATDLILLVMNDRHYVGNHQNGVISNVLVVLITVLSFVLAAVSLPLEILGG